ncbi:MAG: hypothetical protein WC663_04745 [Patescibacteria group bacterium]|jgi:hypothetical protein
MKKVRVKNKKNIGIEKLAKEMRAGFKEMHKEMNASFKEMHAGFKEMHANFKEVDKRFYELYDFLQKHMVTKEELNNILSNYATKKDLQEVKNELMNTMDKIVGDYNTDKQEHVTFILHLDRLAEMEIKIGKMDKEIKTIKNIIFKDARFSCSR